MPSWSIVRRWTTALLFFVAFVGCAQGISEEESQAQVAAALAEQQQDLEERIDEAVAEALATTSTGAFPAPPTTATPYDECAAYRGAVEAAFAWDYEGNDWDLARKNLNVQFPSPDEDGSELTLDEAGVAGEYLRAYYRSELIWNEWDTLSRIAPPSVVSAHHAQLVEGLYDYWQVQMRYSIALYPSRLYGKVTGMGSSEQEIEEKRVLLDPAYLLVERSRSLALALCPDP
jgi:hypothetical protein